MLKSPQSQNSYRVYYDEEKDKYYRLNKITGSVESSYKSGKVPAKFDPQITGVSFINRKIKDKKLLSLSISQSDDNKSKQTQKQSIHLAKSPSKISSKNLFETIQQEALPKIGLRNKQKNPSINELNYSRFDIRFKERKSQNTNGHNISFRKKLINQDKFALPLAKLSILTGQDDSINQSRLNTLTFESRLKKFSSLKNKIFQQSIFHQKEQKQVHGNSSLQESKFSLHSLATLANKPSVNANKTINKQQVNIQIKNLAAQKKSIQSLYQRSHVQNHHKRRSHQNHLTQASQQKLSRQHHLKQQKQKKIFLNFHPEYIFKENQRLIKEQKDRRINFKQLEAMFLNVNNRETNKIYKSNEKHNQQQSK